MWCTLLCRYNLCNIFIFNTKCLISPTNNNVLTKNHACIESHPAVFIRAACIFIYNRGRMALQKGTVEDC